MYQIIFANLDTIAMGGSFGFVIWLATRWTHGRWVHKWIKRPAKVKGRQDYYTNT